MCTRTQKPLLVSGGPMMAYYYLCATDLDRAVDILNKNPKKQISECMHIKPLQLESRLIDPVTGDLYQYNESRKTWEPRINSGMHYKQMNEMDPVLKHMNQRPLFNVKPVDEDYPLIKGVNIEAIIQLDPVHTSLFIRTTEMIT